jgi:hypothetical protein
MIKGNVDARCLPEEGRKQPIIGKGRFASKLYYQFPLDYLVPQSYLLREIADAIGFFTTYASIQHR